VHYGGAGSRWRRAAAGDGHCMAGAPGRTRTDTPLGTGFWVTQVCL